MINLYEIYHKVAAVQNGTGTSHSWENYNTDMVWDAAWKNDTERLAQLHEQWITHMGDHVYTYGRLIDV